MRWTNQEIRNLLRAMRRPHALERERLAVMLREAMGTRDARTAIQSIIERSFDTSSPADRLRLEIVRRCDVGGETTRAAAAALNLSVRQFFRIRAEAIACIAESVERELRRAPNSENNLALLAQSIERIDPKAALDIYLRLPSKGDGETAYNVVRSSIWAGIEVTPQQIDACEGPWRLLALAAVARHRVSRGDEDGALALRDQLREELKQPKGPRYDAAAFELAFLDRCDASRRGDTTQSRALLKTLRSYAGQDDGLQALTLLCEADQASTEGDLTAASLALGDVESLAVYKKDLNVMARTALGKAMLSLVRGFYDDAYALAAGASQAMSSLEAAFSWRAAGISGRAALLLGQRWTPSQALVDRYPTVWTRSLAEGVQARHLLLADASAARAKAEFALALAEQYQCPAYSAYAQVSLAGALDKLGEQERAQELRVAAWESAARLDDRFTLYDLFYNPHAIPHTVGAIIADERFANAVLKYLEEKVPTYSDLRRRATGESVAALARYCLDLGVGNPTPAPNLEDLTRPLAEGLRRGHDDALLLRAHCDAIGRVAARAVGWCVAPAERVRFEERFIAKWNAGTDRARVLICPEMANWQEAV